MPTQLLLEYTQREKRPKPQYHSARARGGKGGKGAAAQEEDEDDWRKYLHKDEPEEVAPKEWRKRVVLEDAKHADRSLSFCPAQASPTEELAREHAALLALLQASGTSSNSDTPKTHIN